MSELYGKIREATKIDFSFYKQSTLLRRVNRRLIATQTTEWVDADGTLVHYSDVYGQDRRLAKLLETD